MSGRPARAARRVQQLLGDERVVLRREARGLRRAVAVRTEDRYGLAQPFRRTRLEQQRRPLRREQLQRRRARPAARRPRRSTFTTETSGSGPAARHSASTVVASTSISSPVPRPSPTSVVEWNIESSPRRRTSLPLHSPAATGRTSTFVRPFRRRFSSSRWTFQGAGSSASTRSALAASGTVNMPTFAPTSTAAVPGRFPRAATRSPAPRSCPPSASRARDPPGTGRTRAHLRVGDLEAFRRRGEQGAEQPLDHEFLAELPLRSAPSTSGPARSAARRIAAGGAPPAARTGERSAHSRPSPRRAP